jgi:hypothetical protein
LPLFLAASLLAPPADAYSVLSHEALVDLAWEGSLLPRLRERFPEASAEQLQKARAFAYGGCVIQDLGYYPFGNRLFTDLTHYVRTGAFVSALVAESTSLEEYAFALGAASHYSGDGNGHALGTNRAVPLANPDLRRKYGNVVTYADHPAAHVRMEFGFDVVQAAAGRYRSAAYMDYIGFEVATPLLERAFPRTYGLEMKDLFTDLGRAVGSYRRSVSRVIPEMTREAWKRRQDEIRRLDPQASEARFVFRLPRSEYDRRFGTRYREPGFLAKAVGFLVRIVPKIGPLKLLVPKLPTPEGERLFRESLAVSLEDYRTVLDAVGEAGTANLQNINLDVGPPVRAGEYRLSDEAYASLLLLLAGKDFEKVPPALKQDILTFYSDLSAPIATKQDEKRWKRTLHALEELQGMK